MRVGGYPWIGMGEVRTWDITHNYYVLCFYHVISVSISCSSEGFTMFSSFPPHVLFIFPLCFAHGHCPLSS